MQFMSCGLYILAGKTEEEQISTCCLKDPKEKSRANKEQLWCVHDLGGRRPLIGDE